MAMGKYSRIDGRKSSHCSTVSIVVVLAVCLVGVWMLMSSSAGPTQNLEFSSEEAATQAMPKSVSKQLSGQEDTEEGKYESTTESVDRTEDKLEDKKAVENTDENTPSEDQNGKQDAENQDGEISKETSDDKNESQEVPKFEDQNGKPDEESAEAEKQGSDVNSSGQNESAENSGDSRSDSVTSEENLNKNSEETVNNITKESEEKEAASNESSASELSEISSESTSVNGAWSTQRTESQNEKKMQTSSSSADQSTYEWKLCNVTAGPDYIPCLDNWQAIKKSSRRHYEHRERHCPEEAPRCLVPLPEGYRRSLKWPKSRDKIWYFNVPHTKLAEVKGHQNWVKVTGEYLTFPGGGTQFIHGALHYIDFIQDSVPDIAWGKRSRVILDVGCGVASFGGYLFERDVLAMSFAPKDEHEAQVQFALERGIPAISNVMGTKRLPFPGSVFDIVHCARCRVPWHAEGGKLLLELNRLLRPGGFFVWSATPVYQNLPEDVEIWKAMSKLTKAMCWEMVAVKSDKLNSVGAAIFRKPTSNECYDNRPKNEPPLCEESDDPNAAWNVLLEACMHRVPVDPSVRGTVWPEQWPARLEKAPYWLSSQVGVYGKPAPEDFKADTKRWKKIVSKSYLNEMGIDWSSVRNVMDMRAVYGGFAAALTDLKVWVMSVVPIDSADTLPIIYERGLFGIYHDWCESFNTYPRTYDLLHADHLFSSLKKRCKLVTVFAEIDRILRPEGKLIVRDNAEAIAEAESIAKSLHWKIQMVYSKDKEGVLCIQKTMWRPTEIETVYYAIA